MSGALEDLGNILDDVLRHCDETDAKLRKIRKQIRKLRGKKRKSETESEAEPATAAEECVAQ